MKGGLDRLDSDSSDMDGMARRKEETRELKRQRKLEIQNRFKLKPEDDSDPNKNIGRSKLMIRIHRMEHKKEDVHSEDNMQNSFDESASEISYGEEDEEVDE